MARRMSTHTAWPTAFAAAASLAIASSAAAQTPPPATPPAQTPPPATAAQDPAAAPNPTQDAAKQHLTAARNSLSELTQLPAASQLTGEARTQVQQLISNFNELITTKTNWRESYAKVEGTLEMLLPPEPSPAASATPGAVGTSGTTPAIDPALRAKLVDFREHLNKFEAVAAATPAPTAAPASAVSEPSPTASTPAAAGSTTSTSAATDEPRPDPEPSSEGISAEDILLHIEAIEALLGAQSTAQSAATSAAGGAVTTSPTASGSTRTTVNNADVTLTPSQLDQIKAHLADIRRGVEKK